MVGMQKTVNVKLKYYSPKKNYSACGKYVGNKQFRDAKPTTP